LQFSSQLLTYLQYVANQTIPYLIKSVVRSTSRENVVRPPEEFWRKWCRTPKPNASAHEFLFLLEMISLECWTFLVQCACEVTYPSSQLSCHSIPVVNQCSHDASEPLMLRITFCWKGVGARTPKWEIWPLT
jgi:hypothetical protein